MNVEAHHRAISSKHRHCFAAPDCFDLRRYSVPAPKLPVTMVLSHGR
jgi:hypothetical protein